LNIDSIHLDSSKAYSTKSGRTVYGGGGIMPDLFVPADTSDRSTYLSELFFSGALNRYAFDVADRHRSKLKQYGDPKRFNSAYSITQAQLEGLAREAKSLGVDYDPQGLKVSAPVVALRLKAGIARNIWGENGYYRVLLGDDRIYERAREALQQ
jgi:carboxyl-terminal processing protease